MKLLIVGTGGHSKIIADIALQQGYNDIFFLDINIKNKKKFLGEKILNLKNIHYGFNNIDNLKYIKNAFVAIGDNMIRENYFLKLKKLKFKLITFIHTTACISKFAKIGDGTLINAGVVINAGAKISENCIINSSAIIEHDVKISKNCHIAPGANICGGCSIGRNTLIGVGTSILPNIKIGSKVTVGGGSLVNKPIRSNSTSFGVPARII